VRQPELSGKKLLRFQIEMQQQPVQNIQKLISCGEKINGLLIDRYNI